MQNNNRRTLIKTNHYWKTYSTLTRKKQKDQSSILKKKLWINPFQIKIKLNDGLPKKQRNHLNGTNQRIVKSNLHH